MILHSNDGWSHIQIGGLDGRGGGRDGEGGMEMRFVDDDDDDDSKDT